MNQSKSLALDPVPRDGVTFFTHHESPVIVISRDLRKIAAFLQQHEPYKRLRRFDDWWEHDSLFFEKGEIDLHGLFELIGTPKSLLMSMQGDHRVFVGVEDLDRTWYLRAFAEWDERDENLIGEYSITFDNPLLSDSFERNVKSELHCLVTTEDATTYFSRIKA